MILGGAALDDERPRLSVFLLFAGGATIAYNLVNFIRATEARNAANSR